MVVNGCKWFRFKNSLKLFYYENFYSELEKLS